MDFGPANDDSTGALTAPPNHPVVLVVDDTPAIASLISTWLRDEFRVYVANTGIEAIKLADEVRPQVAVIDILMARPNGFEIAETLRAQAALADLPIVFMTGLPRPENSVRAKQIGAVDVLQKPLDREVLTTAVRRALAT
jgi:putative two-component system response regulator